MQEELKRLTDFCEGVGGFVSRNRKIRYTLAEMPGKIGLQLRTHGGIKCKFYFGYKVPENVVEEIFNILLDIPDLERLELINISYIPEKIGDLRYLKILGIESKYIESLPVEISHIKTLKELTLRLEKMKEFPNWILQMKALKVLDLFGSGIREIPKEIDKLTNIRVLDLCGMHLKSIPSSILNLNLPIKNHFNELKDEGIYFCDSFCENPPNNVIIGGRERMKIYFQNNAYVLQSEVRVILLGEQGSGKTSLAERLKELTDGKSHYKRNKGWTEGISISDISCNNHGMLHVWDFGGQEILLSTHTLFLRDYCIYIVVLNARQGDKPEKWLDYIRQYGGNNSTVYIVNNHMDERGSSEIDFNKLKRLYPNLLREDDKLWGISCEKPEEFPLDGFYKQLCEEGDEYFKREIPVTWNEVSLQLSDMKKNNKKVNYITRKDYIKICMENGIKKQKEQIEVLKWLNEIGIVFSYGNIEELSYMNEFNVLRPVWVTDAIYKIIRNIHEQKIGCLISHDDIRSALKIGKEGDEAENLYSEREIYFVLDVMRKFGLSYQISDIKEFIPGVAEANEFSEVKEWTENEEDIILDMTYSLSFKNDMEDRETSVNLTQFYQVVIKLVSKCGKNTEIPKMWRRGALYSDFLGTKVLLFLDDGGNVLNRLRLLIKGRMELKREAAKIQWMVFRYLEELIAEYKVNAGILLKNDGKKHYFSIEKAIKYKFNKGDICYDTTLDIDINLYEGIISRVIPCDDIWYRDESDKISREVKEGLKTPTEGYREIMNDYNNVKQEDLEFF